VGGERIRRGVTPGHGLGGPDRARRRAAGLLALAATMALAACGSSSPHTGASTTAATPDLSGPRTAQFALTQPQSGGSSALHGATLAVSTPAALQGGGVSPRNTCKGANISPALKWTGVPYAAPNAKELLVYVRTILPHGKLETDWALAGLKPNLEEIAEGKTPPGAIVGRNSEGKVGYSLCPPPKTYVTMAVYAIPKSTSVTTGFDPEKLRPLLESAETEWGGKTITAYKPGSQG